MRLTFEALTWILAATTAQVDTDDLRPGLVAEYRSNVEPEARIGRIEPKPAFTLGHSSPHPRLPHGPFTVTWEGLLQVRERGPIRFDAFVSGEVTLEVDGVTVLAGQGSSETSRLEGRLPFDRKPGTYALKLMFRSKPGTPARLQLWWRGPTFAAEPIPAWRFWHSAADVPALVRDDEQAQAGRTLAGRLGCARCHREAFPSVSDPPPGPALSDLRGRVSRDWLLRRLADPAAVHGDARMPAVFSADRTGFVERWILADALAPETAAQPREVPGNYRLGRQVFLSVGCIACHLVPDLPREEQADLDRTPLRGLGDRFTPDGLAGFLANPHGRYPDGRMPRLGLTAEQARDIAAYLLLWSPPTDVALEKAPSAAELEAAYRRLQARGAPAAAAALLRERRCLQCHPGLGPSEPDRVQIARWSEDFHGGANSTVRYSLDASARKALVAYGKVAAREKHSSPFVERQRHLERAGCFRCHPRDTDRPAPLEVASSTLGGAYLQYVPFQRTPRLTFPHQKFERSYLAGTVREGVSGLRTERYSFRMPAFGAAADTLVQALAEADGELPAGDDTVPSRPADPTAASLLGPTLVGFQGYACVSCHVWKGQRLSETDPGNLGSDLTRVAGRIRRDWFDRFLEDPARFHPGTPMPAIFTHGKGALLTSVLDGDSARQRNALWHYFALGKDAPSPKPPPPLAIEVPPGGPLVAQVPMHLPDGKLVESLTVLGPRKDLFVYDLGSGARPAHIKHR